LKILLLLVEVNAVRMAEYTAQFLDALRPNWIQQTPKGRQTYLDWLQSTGAAATAHTKAVMKPGASNQQTLPTVLASSCSCSKEVFAALFSY
jgi:hypothetical protein